MENRPNQIRGASACVDTADNNVDQVCRPTLKFYLKKIRNWTIGLGALGFFCIGYYRMAQDVYAEQANEELAKKEAVWKQKIDERDFVKSQVDRIVNAISNRPTEVIILIQETHNHQHCYE